VTVRLRLLLTLGGIIVLLALPALYGVTQLQRLRALAESLEAVHAGDVLALGNLRASLSELDRMQRSYVAAADPRFREGMHTHVALAQAQVGLLDRSNFSEEMAPSRRLLDSLAEATVRLEALVEAGRHEEATQYFESVKPVLDESRLALDPVAVALDQRGQRARAEARQVSAAGARTTLLVVLIALLLTAALGLWTAGALSRPLGRLSAATAAVADGDFVAPPGLPYDRDDEIGELSRAFRVMTERLAELDRLKAEFLSLATHELKTPINVIGGYAELLDEGLYGDLKPKQKDVVALIQDQTRSLTRLVNQLLDLSRFEAGGVPIEAVPVNLPDLLRDVEGAFHALATQKQVGFRIDVDPALPSIVVLDPERIRHEVLGNLLSNAFKFTPTGGEVRVRAWSVETDVHIEVDDTGVGIPQDQIVHIFDKYYQVGADAKSQGAGLGLAIVKHVVEAHDGRITAESSPGQGTCFEIVLPRAARSA
jgi:two-component system, NtrC family, sensor histidine kinase GlrK